MSRTRTAVVTAILLTLSLGGATDTTAQENRDGLPLRVYLGIDISDSLLSGQQASATVARIRALIQGLKASLDRDEDRVVPVLFGGGSRFYPEIGAREFRLDLLTAWGTGIEEIQKREKCVVCGDTPHHELMPKLQPHKTAFRQVIEEISSVAKAASKLDQGVRRRVVILLVTDGEQSSDDSRLPDPGIDLGGSSAMRGIWFSVAVVAHSKLKAEETKSRWGDAAVQSKIAHRFSYTDFLLRSAIDGETQALIRRLRRLHTVTLYGEPEKAKPEIRDQRLRLSVHINRDTGGQRFRLYAKGVSLIPSDDRDRADVKEQNIFPYRVEGDSPSEDVPIVVLLPAGTPLVNLMRSTFRVELGYRIEDSTGGLVDEDTAGIGSAGGPIKFDLLFYDNVVWQFWEVWGVTSFMNRLFGKHDLWSLIIPVKFSGVQGDQHLYWRTHERGYEVSAIQSGEEAGGRIEPAPPATVPILLKNDRVVDLLVTIKRRSKSGVVGNDIEWLATPGRSFESPSDGPRAHLSIAVLVRWQAVASLMSWILSTAVAVSVFLYFGRGLQTRLRKWFGPASWPHRLCEQLCRIVPDCISHGRFFGRGAIVLVVAAVLHVWPLLELPKWYTFINQSYVIFLIVCFSALWRLRRRHALSAGIALFATFASVFRPIRSLLADSFGAALLRPLVGDRLDETSLLVLLLVLVLLPPLVRGGWRHVTTPVTR